MKDTKKGQVVPWAIAGTLLSGILLLMGRQRLFGQAFLHNDDIARAVQIRDLWNGQGWFDLHQYRLGLEPPIVMHWTRHVDLLVSALALPFRAFLTDETSLQIAGILLPLGLLWALLWIGARIATVIGGREAFVPALFFVSISVWTLFQFGIGRIDHHGLQIVLALALLMSVLRIERHRSALFGALAAGTALSIGLESVGVVAGAMLAVGLVYVRVGRPAANGTAIFFIGTPVIATMSTLIFGPSGRLLTNACDVFSQPTLWPLIVIGLAVVALTRIDAPRPTHRFALVTGAAGSGVGLLAVRSPICLEGPYAFVDPWLRDNWMTNISEMQNTVSQFGREPGWVVGWALVGVLALALGVVAFRNEPPSGPTWRIAPFIIPPILVALAQARGVAIVTALAAPYLAVWFLRASQRLSLENPVARGIVHAGLVIALSGVLLPLLWAHPQPTTSKVCQHPDVTTLPQFPPGSRVLAPIDLGPELLMRLPQIHVIAAPYHRNNAGNLLSMQVPRLESSDAATALHSSEVDFYLLCDSGRTREAGTINAALLDADPRSKVPSYLRLVPSPEPFLVFEVLP